MVGGFQNLSEALISAVGRVAYWYDAGLCYLTDWRWATSAQGEIDAIGWVVVGRRFEVIGVVFSCSQCNGLIGSRVTDMMYKSLH